MTKHIVRRMESALKAQTQTIEPNKRLQIRFRRSPRPLVVPIVTTHWIKLARDGRLYEKQVSQTAAEVFDATITSQEYDCGAWCSGPKWPILYRVVATFRERCDSAAAESYEGAAAPDLQHFGFHS
jgi:hypothetical protein